MINYTKDDIFTSAFMKSTSAFIEGVLKKDMVLMAEAHACIHELTVNFYKYFNKEKKKIFPRKLNSLVSTFMEENIWPLSPDSVQKSFNIFFKSAITEYDKEELGND